MRQLLGGALEVWGIAGHVTLADAGEGAAVLRAEDGVEVEVSVSAGPQGRWRVRVARPPRDGRPGDERVTMHAGIPGLLRTVRAALAPAQRAGRMIIAPTPGQG